MHTEDVVKQLKRRDEAVGMRRDGRSCSRSFVFQTKTRWHLLLALPEKVRGVKKEEGKTVNNKGYPS
jgi:hypothetical protein